MRSRPLALAIALFCGDVGVSYAQQSSTATAPSATASNAPASTAYGAPIAPTGSASSTTAAPPASTDVAATKSPGAAGVARRSVPRPNPPTPEQVQGLQRLSEEVKVFSEGAKHFQKSLTMVVRHH